MVALGHDGVVECKSIVQFSSVLMTGGGGLKRSQWHHFELSNVADITLGLLSAKHISSPVLPAVLFFFFLFFCFDPVLHL